MFATFLRSNFFLQSFSLNLKKKKKNADKISLSIKRVQKMRTLAQSVSISILNGRSFEDQREAMEVLLNWHINPGGNER